MNPEREHEEDGRQRPLASTLTQEVCTRPVRHDEAVVVWNGGLVWNGYRA